MSRRLRPWAVGGAVAALVTAANGSQGGYFSQSWGWIALAFIGAVSLALVVGVAARPGWLRGSFAALVFALAVWVVLSATWSISPAASLREAERMLVYLGLAAAVAFVLRRGDAAAVGVGLFVGAVSVTGYGLATRLFPDRLESYDSPTLPYRLAEPLGYWNALGLLATMGALLGLGLVAHGRRLSLVAVAGGCLPVLATTLYFAFSRGAWLALAVGLVALVVIDPRRLRLLWMVAIVAPISAVGVAVASRQEALTTEDAVRADSVDQGRDVAVVIVALVLASGAAAVAARWLASRIRAPRWAARAVDVGLAACAVVAAVTALVLVGGPADAVAEIEERFDAPPLVAGPNLNERLFQISSNGRVTSIEVAWDAGRERPALGHGAGSYEYLWYERRPNKGIIRDAHSLPAETFAELGAVGVALLGLALVLPLVAAVRARRQRLVPAAVSAYTAWIASASLDWHWEMVGLTTVALLAGGVALLAAERGQSRALPSSARWPLLAASVAMTLMALVSLVGNQALFAGREALARDELRKAHDHAERAKALLPWSFEPYYVLGDVAGRRGDRAEALRAYRRAVEIDGDNWVAWLRLAQVAQGVERRAAYARVRELNPLEGELPGEDAEAP